MKRTLYRIELYNRDTEGGRIKREQHYAGDTVAIHNAAKMLRQYRSVHRHGPTPCDRWALFNIDPGRPHHQVAFGDADGRLPRSRAPQPAPPAGLFQ